MASNPHIKTPAFQFHKGTIWTGQLSCEKFKYIFQFHKGTIWTCSTVWYLWFCTLFQFHKGTIWTHNTHYSRRVFYYFNSIKVQFERRNLRARILSYQIFQFHKGTIWTELLPCFVQELNPFQFHKGTIWTIGSTIAGGYQANFNSIKVQFEPSACMATNLPMIYFNSIKVQFELDEIQGILVWRIFQFHKGTIWTMQS